MSKGEDSLTPEETALLELLVQLIERFEEQAYPIPDAPGYRVLFRKDWFLARYTEIT
ncbi:MAG: hypothetical protein ACREAB_16230 [Blastocatellia bacterium]